MFHIRKKAEAFVRKHSPHYFQLSVTKDVDSDDVIVGLNSKRLLISEVFEVAKELNRQGMKENIGFVVVAEDGLRLTPVEYYLAKREIAEEIEHIGLSDEPSFMASYLADVFNLEADVLLPILGDFLEEEIIYVRYAMDVEDDREFKRLSDVPHEINGITIDSDNIYLIYYVTDELIEKLKESRGKE